MFDLKAIIFILVFMTITYILLLPEITPYMNVASRLQGRRFNLYKDKDNNFKYFSRLALLLVNNL